MMNVSIDRRELVTIYSSIERETESEISRLAFDSAYDDAKEMRFRLTNLKSEFTGLQTTSAQLIRDDQSKYFDKASNDLLKKAKSNHLLRLKENADHCNQLRDDQKHSFEIQKQNLELQIINTRAPCIKYSKNLIELMKSESR